MEKPSAVPMSGKGMAEPKISLEQVAVKNELRARVEPENGL